MLNRKITALVGAAALAATAGQASALDVNSNITTDTTWTKADSPVQLRDPVFVTDGASLTIEAGVVVVTGAADDGGIVVEKEAQIFVLGTKEQPVIMTSLNDVATWDGSDVEDTNGDGEFEEINALGDPTTGTWREVVQEWRNLTILGEGIVSSYSFADNPRNGSDGAQNLEVGTAADPNEVQMEGLNQGEGSGGDSVFYGGANDDDDSGTIRYLSSRYAGRVLGEGNELNGMSLGGVGRGTDMSYIEIMNNVDDGIEIWGGTVNLSHFQIWNIGDDSLDFDQGWRGRAQFGLIVQGYSTDASQGSGVGDNAIEFDGAEDSDGQPRSTPTLYNLTVIGQPDADGLTAWRDNARPQFHKSVFMSAGESLIRLDDSDGDGGEGYGFNGTHTWSDVWTTPETDLSPNGVNEGTGDFAPSALYTTHQTDSVNASLAAMRDSVAWDVSTLYTNQSHLGTPRGGNFDPTTDPNADFDVVDAGSDASSRPIQAIERETPVTKGGLTMARVIELDPRAANDALNTSDPLPPFDGFWTPADYRGAFSETHNWADGWSAASAYGFFPGDQTSADPEATFEVQVTTTSFQTENGQSYVIECSTDGRDWDPVEVVEGDGTLKTVANEISVDENKIYRVRVQ